MTNFFLFFVFYCIILLHDLYMSIIFHFFIVVYCLGGLVFEIKKEKAQIPPITVPTQVIPNNILSGVPLIKYTGVSKFFCNREE